LFSFSLSEEEDEEEGAAAAAAAAGLLLARRRGRFRSPGYTQTLSALEKQQDNRDKRER
jgi:hypothetical protein